MNYRPKVIALHHDNPESVHFGSLKMAELVSWNFDWPALCANTSPGARCVTESRQLAKYGVNIPIEPPNQPWEGVTMDFVTDLPESTASGILVVVDLLTKIAIYLPYHKDVDSQR
jgi:hypothetical protein